MERPTLADLVAERVLDAELASLLWLLGEGGIPLVVSGTADATARSALATALLSADPSRAWVLLDADTEPPTTSRLSSLLQGGVAMGISLAAHDLRDVLARLEAPPFDLPADGVRRLGVVVLMESTGLGSRLPAVHYLRPSERDAQAHVQRRPPAVLATWDGVRDTYEHFAWGITPELADRIDRAQADLEDRQRDRAAFLAEAAADGPIGVAAWEVSSRRYLETEPRRVPAPPREPATPSAFGGGISDPHVH